MFEDVYAKGKNPADMKDDLCNTVLFGRFGFTKGCFDQYLMEKKELEAGHETMMERMFEHHSKDENEKEKENGKEKEKEKDEEKEKEKGKEKEKEKDIEREQEKEKEQQEHKEHRDRRRVKTKRSNVSSTASPRRKKRRTF